MRVLVTGGRDYSSYEERMWLYAGLSLLHSMSPVTEIIEGGATGFDMNARNWALWRQACGDKLKLTTVPAQWEQHGKSAGYIRNSEMARMRPDVVLACPGGKGTSNMVEVANAAKLRVVFLAKMPIAGPKRKGADVPPPPPVASAA
jgi:hypothetical protein